MSRRRGPAFRTAISRASGTTKGGHKAVGDQVTEGEPLLEIGTDKVDTDIPAPISGTLAEIRVEADQTVPVGTVIAVIS